jgi:hypothetical protein
MSDAIYASKGSFFSRLCSKFDRHPGRKSRNDRLPHAMLFPDLPVFKYGSKWPLRDVTINHGLHVAGMVTVPIESRVKTDLCSHIDENSSWYNVKGIKRIDVVPITYNPHDVADYATKTLKSGKIDWDTTIILPRAYDELRGGVIKMDAHTRAIKEIQSAQNVSDEMAEEIFNCRLLK